MSITLEYPYAAPTLTVTLPNPMFDNRELLNIKTAYNQTMDGTFRTYKRTPSIYTITYAFDSAKKVTTPSACIVDHLSEVYVFMRAAFGSWVKLTDYDSVAWKIKILTSPASFVERRDGLYDLTLTMKGTKA